MQEPQTAMRLLFQATPEGPTLEVSFSSRRTVSEDRRSSSNIQTGDTSWRSAGFADPSYDSNAMENLSTTPNTVTPLPSELPDTSVTSSAGKTLPPTMETPILQALQSIFNTIPDLEKLVESGIPSHTQSTLPHGLNTGKQVVCSCSGSLLCQTAIGGRT